MCAELGVNHFSRRGVERWNQPTGPHRARTKHGNYNAWLDAHGERYDFMLGVDPDHVPLPNFAERFLGYFRDPDVAFVVGPQVYGNYQGFVVRSAESQQFLFHSLLQRAGNRSRTPMLVGTNNALRLTALRQIGGFQDSITEDMATSLVIHTARNPETAARWTSVYTPDVVSVGEGPASFTDYFSQQDRWSRGTDEVLVRRFWRMAHRLGPRALVHYLLLTCYYPTAAIAWILGVVNAILYFALGAGGVVVPAHLWLMLYVDAAALQVGLYFFNRRHNVSPHEKKGSAGVAGMLISALSAPIYAASLAAVALRRSRGLRDHAEGRRQHARHRRSPSASTCSGRSCSACRWRSRSRSATTTSRCGPGRSRRWSCACCRSPSGASSCSASARAGARGRAEARAPRAARRRCRSRRRSRFACGPCRICRREPVPAEPLAPRRPSPRARGGPSASAAGAIRSCASTGASRSAGTATARSSARPTGRSRCAS